MLVAPKGQNRVVPSPLESRFNFKKSNLLFVFRRLSIPVRSAFGNFSYFLCDLSFVLSCLIEGFELLVVFAPETEFAL
ncbi:hypothetical protein Nepgr_000497 [Nepenthes gracilis]|uniref:Uncharacterized protein n=1 Tax=Nepenthes gracilis TaxID=150966 RepID=A0AAD3P5D5_NEPGR|nr:hypothetical protein Nepgr_000497 [Nepenthes gracilis]